MGAKTFGSYKRSEARHRLQARYWSIVEHGWYAFGFAALHDNPVLSRKGSSKVDEVWKHYTETQSHPRIGLLFSVVLNVSALSSQIFEAFLLAHNQYGRYRDPSDNKANLEDSSISWLGRKCSRKTRTCDAKPLQYTHSARIRSPIGFDNRRVLSIWL